MLAIAPEPLLFKLALFPDEENKLKTTRIVVRMNLAPAKLFIEICLFYIVIIWIGIAGNAGDLRYLDLQQ